jgi:hypothetical protein
VREVFVLGLYRQKQFDGVARQPCTIGRSSVVLRHLPCGPPEDCHKLPFARAAFSSARRARLAETVGGPRTASRTAGLPEPIPKAFFHPRSAALCDEVCQIAGPGRRDRSHLPRWPDGCWT